MSGPFLTADDLTEMDVRVLRAISKANDAGYYPATVGDVARIVYDGEIDIDKIDAARLRAVDTSLARLSDTVAIDKKGRTAH